MYLHLTTHSAYSQLEGLPLPSELAQAAQASGMAALGLTGHRTLTGSIEFVHACRQAKDVVLSSMPFLVSGTMEMDIAGEEPLLKAEKVVSLD